MQSTCALVYYHVFRVSLRRLFSHNLLTEKNFGKEAIEQKMPFLILYIYVYSFRKSDFVLNICLFFLNNHYSCQELVEF